MTVMEVKPVPLCVIDITTKSRDSVDAFMQLSIEGTTLLTFPGHRRIYAPFDAVVVCCIFCTLLVLNVVWSLIQGFQICKLRPYRLCIAIYSPSEASKFVC